MAREFSIEAERSTFRLSRLTRERIAELMRDWDQDATSVITIAIEQLWQREIGEAPRDVLGELDELKARVERLEGSGALEPA
jgi:hypothetical protein